MIPSIIYTVQLFAPMCQSRVKNASMASYRLWLMDGAALGELKALRGFAPSGHHVEMPSPAEEKPASDSRNPQM